MRELLEYDPIVGRARIFHGHNDGSFTIETRQDVTDLVEENKALKNDLDGQHFKGDGMHLVGRIPDFIHQYLRASGILRDQKRLQAWFNDPANAVWKLRRI